MGQTQAGKLAAQESDTLTDTDLPAYQLADKDSLFIECNGLRVHYKEVHPAEVRAMPGDAAVYVCPSCTALLLGFDSKRMWPYSLQAE